MEHSRKRRDVIKGLAAASISAAKADSAIERRVLGSTGEKVSCIGLGGSHIGGPKVSDADAQRIIRAAIDRGLNFMDNSWDYNGGRSEILMGKACATAIARRPS